MTKKTKQKNAYAVNTIITLTQSQMIGKLCNIFFYSIGLHELLYSLKNNLLLFFLNLFFPHARLNVAQGKCECNVTGRNSYLQVVCFPLQCLIFFSSFDGGVGIKALSSLPLLLKEA